MPRAAAAATSAVLDNDDLLGEILLRLAFPTSLVRAALVCKRWLRLASAPAFLRHFRHLHPPHLLGFYVTTRTNPPTFVPMPQPPELASVVRRASFDLVPRIDLLLPNSLIVGDKIYNMACVGGSNRLVSLDLSSSCLSLVNLPEEVEFKRTELSLENDYSEVHLNHVKGSQLRIWLHMVDNDDGLANWLLVNTICLHEICADYMIPTSVLEDVGDSKLLVYAAGVDSGLFFMEKDEVLYLFDIKRKTAKKVFDATREDKRLDEVTPFMMVWPPKFPGMTDEGCDPI